MRQVRAPGDVVVASIHWGSYWGYEVPDAHVRFAHWLVNGGVNIVHGHSSSIHGPSSCTRDRLILYGCGDLIDDYEGIEGYEQYRDDLVLMYFATLSLPNGGETRTVETVCCRKSGSRMNLQRSVVAAASLHLRSAPL